MIYGTRERHASASAWGVFRFVANTQSEINSIVVRKAASVIHSFRFAIVHAAPK